VGKLYEEFFYIPKHGKIREKVMLTRIAVTVIIMIICIASMSITAYAYFSYNTTSAKSKIQTASFETNVNIQITDENGAAVENITSDYKSHMVTLKANTKYYITLKLTEKSTATTGFVIVAAEGCNEKYHSQQLEKNGSVNVDTLTFYLIVGEDTTVTFLAHWGTSSYYGYMSDSEQYIKQGETVYIPINGVIGAEFSTPITTDKTEAENPPVDSSTQDNVTQSTTETTSSSTIEHL
jgi:hypothetical protein